LVDRFDPAGQPISGQSGGYESDATKVRNRVGPDPGDEGLLARHIRDQIDASLRRLDTDRMDLVCRLKNGLTLLRGVHGQSGRWPLAAGRWG
jgi:hypothetical protein